MPDKRGFFGRLTGAIREKAEQFAHQVERSAERAVSSIRDTAASAVAAVFSFQNRQQELYDENEERIRQIRELNERMQAIIRELTDEQVREAEEDEERVGDYPLVVQDWYYAIGDLNEAVDASESGFQYLRPSQVDQLVNDNTKIRRKPHGSYDSAIEYARDIPPGAVRGITKKGDYWYVIVSTSTNPRKVRGKKRRNRNKRSK